MIVRATSLYTALRVVTIAAGCDAMRANLYALHVDFLPGRARFSATNGHWLIRFAIPREDDPVVGEASATFIITDVLDSLSTLRRLKFPKSVVEISTATGDIALPDERKLFWRKPKSGEFPPLDQVIPKFKADGPKLAHFGVAPALLAKVGRAIELAKKGAYARFQFSGLLDPIFVTSDQIDGLEIVVMPARVNEPTFHFPEAAPAQQKVAS